MMYITNLEFTGEIVSTVEKQLLFELAGVAKQVADEVVQSKERGNISPGLKVIKITVQISEKSTDPS